MRCATPRCEVVSILGADFLRLVEKSRAARDSFEQLHAQRKSHNAAVLAALQEELDDPILRRYEREMGSQKYAYFAGGGGGGGR